MCMHLLRSSSSYHIYIPSYTIYMYLCFRNVLTCIYRNVALAVSDNVWQYFVTWLKEERHEAARRELPFPVYLMRMTKNVSFISVCQWYCSAAVTIVTLISMVTAVGCCNFCSFTLFLEHETETKKTIHDTKNTFIIVKCMEDFI